MTLFSQYELSHFFLHFDSESEWTVGTLCKQLFLQLYSDSFETTDVLTCMWFGYNPHFNFHPFFRHLHYESACGFDICYSIRLYLCNYSIKAWDMNSLNLLVFTLLFCLSLCFVHHLRFRLTIVDRWLPCWERASHVVSCVASSR